MRAGSVLISLGLALSAAQAQATSPFQMVILGDSTVTGAATNPHLKPFWANMLGFVLDVDIFHPETITYVSDYPSPQEFGITRDPVQPLTRITYSHRELEDAEGKGWKAVFDLKGGSKLSRAFDWTEQSFAYLIARALGIPGSQVLLVAQDGKRVSSITEQLERADEVEDTLPPFVLVSYGLNDICHPDDVNGDLQKFKDEFAITVRTQLAAIAHRPPAPEGTTVLISAPLDATNLMINDRLMAQKIPFEGAGIAYGEITCTELRGKSFTRQTVPGLALRGMLIQECRGLRSDTPDLAGRVERVRALQQAQVKIWKDAIAEISSTSHGFKWIFGESIRSVEFTAGDLANDCFHPSRLAHAKVARQFLSHELRAMR